MLRLIAFPASEGDCLLIEYGDRDRPARILIDGGRLSTYRRHLRPYLAALPDGGRTLDLLVVTHIDRDHIEGALALAEDDALGIEVKEVWFNGFKHLPEDPLRLLGPVQGERLSAAIERRGWPWNNVFGGGPVSLGPVPAPTSQRFAQDAMIRLLSPTRACLAALRPIWITVCQEAGLSIGSLPVAAGNTAGGLRVLAARTSHDLGALAALPTSIDRAEPNGTSIAFIFEHAGCRILFAADAHPDLLDEALRQQFGDAAAALDLFKVSHHGSRGNTTTSLCSKLAYSHALISTNGSMFRHPDEEAIARVILGLRSAGQVHFNYATPITRSWDVAGLRKRHAYTPTYPIDGEDGYCILEWVGSDLERSALQSVWPPQ